MLLYRDNAIAGSDYIRLKDHIEPAWSTAGIRGDSVMLAKSVCRFRRADRDHVWIVGWRLNRAVGCTVSLVVEARSRSRIQSSHVAGRAYDEYPTFPRLLGRLAQWIGREGFAD